MSRIRTVKPEFWTSEQVTSGSRDSRLLNIGIWNFADDSGIHSRSPARLKAEIFPADNDISTADVEAMLRELINHGLLDEYEVNGKEYIRVTGWARHQRIDKPTYRHPWPRGTIPKDKSEFEQLFDEYSMSSRRGLDPGMESNGREGKGRESKG